MGEVVGGSGKIGKVSSERWREVGVVVMEDEGEVGRSLDEVDVRGEVEWDERSPESLFRWAMADGVLDQNVCDLISVLERVCGGV